MEHRPDIPPPPEPTGAQAGTPEPGRDDPLGSPPPGSDIGEILEHQPRMRMTSMTLVLGTVVVLGLGFLGGMLAQRQWGTTASASPSTGGSQAGRTFQPGDGFGGGRFGATPGSGVAFGTITRISGDTVYVTTADGSTVKVVTNGQTQIRVTKDGTLSDLTPGTTIVVQGTADSAGSTIQASTIAEGGAGFRGGFGPPQATP